MRVVTNDSRKSSSSQKGILTIPVDTLIKFRVVKGHSKLGKPQRLSEIITENDIPFEVKMACDPYYPVKVGNSKYVASDFEQMLIKEKFYEPYFTMNCIDSPDLKMNKEACMACLSKDVDVAVITGFKYGSKAEYDAFCQKLTDIVKSNENYDEIYDPTKGNPDLCEYTLEDIKDLLEDCEYKSGLISSGNDEFEERDGDYEYPEYIPAVPKRIPKVPNSPDASSSTNSEPAAASSSKASKTPAKPSKHYKKSTTPEDQSGTPDNLSPKTPTHKNFLNAIFKQKPKHEVQPKQQNNPAYGVPIEKDSIIKANTETDVNEVPPPVERPVRNNAEKPAVPPRLAEPLKPLDSTSVCQAGSTMTNKHYQNTMQRATIKPMRKEPCEAEDEEQHRTDFVKTNEEMSAEGQENEPGEYTQLYEAMEPQSNPNDPNSVLTRYETVQPGNNSSLYIVGRVREVREAETVEPDKDKDKSSGFSVKSLSILDLACKLQELKLEKYVKVFKDNQVDGEILASLTVDDLIAELGLKKLEAVRLMKFVESGHIPK